MVKEEEDMKESVLSSISSIPRPAAPGCLDASPWSWRCVANVLAHKVVVGGGQCQESVLHHQHQKPVLLRHGPELNLHHHITKPQGTAGLKEERRKQNNIKN